MWRLEDGDFFASDVEAIVNTVNVVGVMGKGIALEYKRRFPDMFREYKRMCDQKLLRLGHMHVYELGKGDRHKYVINFPTKGHWRDRSRLEDIRAGLEDLVRVLDERNIASVAIPALGCSNGGLSFGDVLPMMQEAMSRLPHVESLLFLPH